MKPTRLFVCENEEKGIPELILAQHALDLPIREQWIMLEEY